MNYFVKFSVLSTVIFSAACCGPVGPNWDTPWDVIYHPCHSAYCNSQYDSAAAYNRAHERRVERGLGGVMYEPMN
jgi:hypothetical protein